MYLAAGAVMAAYLVLCLLSVRRPVTKEVSGSPRFIYRMADFLYECAKARNLPLLNSRQVERDLEKLHPGEDKERLCRTYYVDKTAKSLLLCLAGTILGAVLCFRAGAGNRLEEGGQIRRGTYLEEEQEIILEEMSEQEVFRIKVSEQKLDREEAEALYRDFLAELTNLLPGKNPSLREITQDLILPEALEGYPFQVEWKSECPDFLSSSGKVKAVACEEEFLLTAVVTYEDMEWQQDFPVRVTPCVLSEEDRKYREIEILLQQSEEDTRKEAVWILPKELDGTSLVWKQVVRDDSLLFWVAGLVTAAAVFFLKDKDLHGTLEKRKETLRREYSGIVQKIVLYLGAGMTIRGVFGKMAGEYQQARAAGASKDPVLEEILYTCRELQAGVTETVAYEHFGKRTGVQEYICLCTLLQQNLKKGTSTLLTRLREEADKAALEKLQSSRRRGEEAVTKLLVPMVMMLLVVMVMIMIPAFSSTTF